MTPNISMIARGGHPDFLDLPWDRPLAEWDHERLVKMAHGISRHVVRFVSYDDRVYALKETGAVAARKEYDVLVELYEMWEKPNDAAAWQAVRPCGLSPEVMTDISEVAGRPVTMAEAVAAARETVLLLTDPVDPL